MRIIIITDNTVYKQGLKKEWGFSCLVEVENTPIILFDTGASSSVLLHNMEKLNIDAKTIDCVFISHNHWDHTGGLKGFLKLNDNVKLYLPYSFFSFTRAREIIRVKDPVKIYRRWRRQRNQAINRREYAKKKHHCGIMAANHGCVGSMDMERRPAWNEGRGVP